MNSSFNMVFIFLLSYVLGLIYIQIRQIITARGVRNSWEALETKSF